VAELHGKTGGVYNSAAIIGATTISFENGSSHIHDSGNGFLTAGFLASQKITVIGAAQSGNNNSFALTGSGAAAGTLTITGTPPLVDESAGNLVTIYLQPAGTAVAGFHSWEITHEGDIPEVTDFSDAGVKAYMAGGTGWTGSGERFWQTDNDVWGGGAVGTPRWVRFFLKYVAVPSAPDPAYYYEGLSFVKTGTVKTDVADVIRQTFQFQGSGALTLVTRTSAWA
jgi:hypothetical protein